MRGVSPHLTTLEDERRHDSFVCGGNWGHVNHATARMGVPHVIFRHGLGSMDIHV
jgi:hypothetical protein